MPQCLHCLILHDQYAKCESFAVNTEATVHRRRIRRLNNPKPQHLSVHTFIYSGLNCFWAGFNFFLIMALRPPNRMTPLVELGLVNRRSKVCNSVHLAQLSARKTKLHQVLVTLFWTFSPMTKWLGHSRVKMVLPCHRSPPYNQCTEMATSSGNKAGINLLLTLVRLNAVNAAQPPHQSTPE